MTTMHRPFFLLALVFFTLGCSKKKNVEDKPDEVLPKPTVKVMTFNIYGARPSAGFPPADLNALAAVIKEHDPDIIALQEVDVFTNRSGSNVHQARDLARLTGMNWFFVKAIDKDGGQYGDAILSKLPFKETKGYNLNVAPGVSGELRSVAMAKLEKEGKEFWFSSTHLDHLAIEDNRILQANELKGIVVNLNAPLIIGGDFNAIPESQTMAIIKGFMNLGCRQQCPLTFPAQKPDRTIDYLMYTPVDGFSVQSYQSKPNAVASDHAPVIAVIQIN